MGTFGGSYCEVLSKLILNSMITGTKKKKEEEQRKKRKRTKKEKKKLTFSSGRNKYYMINEAQFIQLNPVR